MTTNAYAAKTALFNLLTTYAQPAQPLDGIDVDYAYNPHGGTECIYGGGVRFEQRDAVAEAPGIVVSEEALISVYIRVAETPPGDVADTDARCAVIGGIIGGILRANPTLGTNHSLIGIARGQGDYTQTDDETISVLAYQIRVVMNLSYGGA